MPFRPILHYALGLRFGKVKSFLKSSPLTGIVLPNMLIGFPRDTNDIFPLVESHPMIVEVLTSVEL